MKSPSIETSPAKDFKKLDNTRPFHVGQTVWVLGLKDILMTLDDDGKLDGLPFMPEMIPYCGRSFRICTLPNRTCVEQAGIWEFRDIVFLDGLRCDGGAHDGCQRRCLLYWRGAWLSDKPPEERAHDSPDVLAAANAKLKTMKGALYSCQSTQLARAATARQDEKPNLGKRLENDLDDLQRGNISLVQFSGHLLATISNRLRRSVGADRGDLIYGNRQKTESVTLNLQPGDWVEIKSRTEIEETLDVDGKNKGLLFTPPMLQYCGKRYRVANRLQRMILEDSGKMIKLNDTVILDNVTCQAWGCQRANLFYWREIWLRRVATDS